MQSMWSNGRIKSLTLLARLRKTWNGTISSRCWQWVSRTCTCQPACPTNPCQVSQLRSRTCTKGRWHLPQTRCSSRLKAANCLPNLWVWPFQPNKLSIDSSNLRRSSASRAPTPLKTSTCCIHNPLVWHLLLIISSWRAAATTLHQVVMKVAHLRIIITSRQSIQTLHLASNSSNEAPRHRSEGSTGPQTPPATSLYKVCALAPPLVPEASRS